MAITACTKGANGWTLTGKVTNSSSAARGYAIAVDFITTPGDTVIATKLVNLQRVAPRTTVGWSTTSATPGHDNIVCVIRQALST